MKATKVIKCKIVGLTKCKRASIEKEYRAVQDALQLEKEGLDFLPMYDNLPIHSHMKADSLKNYNRLCKKEQPISIRKGSFKIERRNNKLAKYWLRIPCFDYIKMRGYQNSSKKKLWVAIKPHMDIPDDVTFAESKIIKKGTDFYFHLTIQKDIVLKTSYSSVLGVDLGIRRIASVCDLCNGHTRFYGKKLRAVRGKYFYLRKKLGEKKLLKVIKRIGNKEKLISNHLLHEISRDIVENAKKTNSAIIIGKLKGIRKQKHGKGRKFGRKLNSFPFYKLTNMIKYKALWEGIMTTEVSEAWTSQTCSQCGERGTRTQGLFKCSCGYEDNSDRNGAINIAKRGLGYISKSGVDTELPIISEMNLECATEKIRC